MDCRGLQSLANELLSSCQAKCHAQAEELREITRLGRAFEAVLEETSLLVRYDFGVLFGPLSRQAGIYCRLFFFFLQTIENVS